MSKRLAHICGAALLLAAMGGCAKKALQEIDGGGIGVLPAGVGGGGGGVGGAGAAGGSGAVTDGGGGGAVDAAWDAGFSGRRSFGVTAQVNSDGGAMPRHTFTMVLDATQRIAITGVSGGGDVTPIVQTGAATFRFDRSLTFGTYVANSCGASVRYDDLTVSIDDSGGLSGTGSGVLTAFNPQAQQTLVTMTLTGVPDHDPPAFSLAAGGDLADPWTPLWVVASEPLPSGQAVPILRSGSGDALPFVPEGSGDFVAVLVRPSRLLRFGEQYRVTFGGITDFAGNAPATAATDAFTTRAAPPLIAADGFESVTDEALGGAQILSGAGAPTISGDRSLYLPPVDVLGTGATVTQFAFRLPIPAGATKLAFSYRIVNLAGTTGDSSNVSYLVASVGGPIQSVSLTDVGSPTTPATIGATAVMLGPTQTAMIPFLPGTSGEVVLARTAAQPSSCLGPAPRPVSGIILDDLRVE